MKKIAMLLLSPAVFLMPTFSYAVVQNLNGLTANTQTFATSTATSPHLRIQSSGSVHTFMWDSTPWTLAQGGTGATSTMAEGSIPFISNGKFSSNSLQFFWDTVSSILSIGGSTTPATKLSVRGSAGLDLFNVASSTGASLLFVSSAGNIGVGTTTPFERLDVVGSGKFSGFLQSNMLTVLGTSTLNGRVGIGNSSPQSALDIFGAFYSQLVTVSGSTIDWNAGNVQSLALTSNPTLVFTNGHAGGEYKIILNQDSTGGRTVGWPGDVKWLLGGAPTLATSSNGTDIIKFIYDGTNYLGFSAVARSAASSPLPSSLLTGLVSYYTFDMISGTSADSTANNNDLTNNGVATFVPGKMGNAAHLVSGSNQGFDIADGSQSGLDITGDLSISLWHGIPPSAVGSVIIRKLGSASVGTRSYMFDLDDSTHVTFGVSADGNNDNRQTWAISPLATSTYYHFAVTYTASAHTAELWVNGVSQGTKDVIQTSINNGASKFGIGIDSVLGNYGNGDFDETGIWNRILSQSEITDLYNSGAGLQYPF